MCLLDRNTASRGRTAVPRTFLRTRRWRRTRCSRLVRLMSFLLGGLAGLALHALAGVADALALVGLGLAQLADVGRDLADELLVEAAHDDARRLRDLEGDPSGRLHVNRVRVADRDLDLFGTLRLRAVPDPDDLELLDEPVGDTGHHVGV